MNLSDVIKIWEILHGKDTGDLGYCDLDEAIDTVVGVENDYGDCRKPITISDSQSDISERAHRVKSSTGTIPSSTEAQDE